MKLFLTADFDNSSRRSRLCRALFYDFRRPLDLELQYKKHLFINLYIIIYIARAVHKIPYQRGLSSSHEPFGLA
jgi:hypothetical protein